MNPVLNPIAWIAVALGGSVGCLVRWQGSLLLQSRFALSAAWSIAWVNGFGGFLIGVALAFAEEGTLAGNWRLLAITGFLGGFTTFSAFAGDMLQLLRAGNIRMFIFLAVVSNAGALLACAAGFFGTRVILR